jgi:hypothetical protein
MTLHVADRGTAEHQISEAAKALGRSPQRIAVFREIHSGKKRIKTATEIADVVGLPRKRVLEEAIKFVHKQIVSLTKREGELAYQRDNFYYAHREQIIKRALGAKAYKPPTDAAAPRVVRSKAAPAPRRRPMRQARRTKKRHDIFLSHASEDKDAIARPLYRALKRKRVSVWFDEGTLRIGDSLRSKIDEGLAHCRYGVVILSPSFFAKDWPKKELDGMVARENLSGEKVILPVWHRVTKTQVTKFSPMLAGRLAGNTKNGIPALVRSIKEVLDS